MSVSAARTGLAAGTTNMVVLDELGGLPAEPMLRAGARQPGTTTVNRGLATQVRSCPSAPCVRSLSQITATTAPAAAPAFAADTHQIDMRHTDRQTGDRAMRLLTQSPSGTTRCPPVRRWLRHRLSGFAADCGGAVAIMAAGLMPLLALGMGLGAETGYHYLQQRNLQHAADVAAHAGAVRLRAGDGHERVAAAAQHVAAQSGFVAAERTIAVNTPPTSGLNAGNASSVEVLLTETHPRYFSAIFVDTPVELQARAVARVLPSDTKACVLALSATAPRAITVSGSTQVSLEGCDVASNSNAPDAFYMANSMAKMSVGCVHAVGEAITSTGLNLASCAAPTEYAPVVRDPYADVAEPGVEGPCLPEARKDDTLFQPDFDHSSGVPSLRICGGIDFKKKVAFQPGLYIIDGGTLSLNANGTVSVSEAGIAASGVTFYLTNGATLRLTGNGSLNLDAPITGPFAGILFFASRSQSGTTHEILGNSGSITQGAIYAPTSAVRFTGNSTTTSGCTQIIGLTVEFTGNSTLKSSCETSNAREIQTDVLVRIVE